MQLLVLRDADSGRVVVFLDKTLAVSFIRASAIILTGSMCDFFIKGQTILIFGIAHSEAVMLRYEIFHNVLQRALYAYPSGSCSKVSLASHRRIIAS